MASGSRVRSSAITSSFTQSVPERLARQLRREHGLGGAAAAGGVGQRGDVQPVEQVQHAGAARRVDAGRIATVVNSVPEAINALFEHREVGGTAGAQDQS